jgi:hypothetical protein
VTSGVSSPILEPLFSFSFQHMSQAFAGQGLSGGTSNQGGKSGVHLRDTIEALDQQRVQNVSSLSDTLFWNIRSAVRNTKASDRRRLSLRAHPVCCRANPSHHVFVGWMTSDAEPELLRGVTDT